MKLGDRDAQAFFRRPDPRAAGVLLYGEDAMRVAQRRQEVIGALIGPEGAAEMRLTRIAAADLRRDGALLADAVKARGFFPGPRVALVEDATDGLSDTIAAALGDWREDDAQIVVSAGSLAAKSKLRKLFESAKAAFAIGIYKDPPGRDEIETALAAAGLKGLGRDAMAALEALARALAPGDFRQVLEKVALYKHGDTAPLTADEVAACAPVSIEAEIDEILDVLAEGRTTEIPALMRRLEGQGVTPVSLLIVGARHFRTLYAVTSAPGGPPDGVARMRPPVYGKRRDRLLRQAQVWRPDRLEQALGILMDADLTLRSAAQRAPQMALVERSFVRLAHLARG